MQGENDELRAKVGRIASLTAEVRKLQQFEGKYARVESANQNLLKEMEKVRAEKLTLMEENADLRARLRKEEEGRVLTTERTTIHIPVYKNRIVDNCLLSKDDLNTTVECYGDRPDFSCLHLNVTHGGPIYKVGHHRIKYRTPGKS